MGRPADIERSDREPLANEAESVTRAPEAEDDRSAQEKPKYFRRYDQKDKRLCAYGRASPSEASNLEGPWQVIGKWTEIVDVFRMHDEEINYFACWRKDGEDLLFAEARDGAEWLNDTKDPRGYLENRTVIQYKDVVRIGPADRFPELTGKLSEVENVIHAIIAADRGDSGIILL